MGQIKSPVPIVVYKFHIKQPRDRSHQESTSVILTFLLEAELENRKPGFEPSQAENRLGLTFLAFWELSKPLNYYVKCRSQEH